MAEDPTERVNAQLEELQKSVKDNIKLQRKRGASLKGLEKRTDKLQEDTGLFKKKSGKVKAKYFWKYLKWVALAGLAIFIIGSILYSTIKK